MKISHSDALRRTIGGVAAGLVLTLGVASAASADAFIDDSGVPVASSGDSTVTIVGGEAVILFGEDGLSEAEVLSASAEENSSSLDDSSGTAISDASGGGYNISLNDERGNGDDD